MNVNRRGARIACASPCGTRARAALAQFSSPLFHNLQLKIKHEIIAILKKILARFNPEKTSWRPTATTSCGTTTSSSVSSATRTASRRSRNSSSMPSEVYVLVPGSQLLTGLLTISLFRTEPDAFVQLHVEGVGNDTRLYMTTRNLADVPSTTTLECSRQAYPSYTTTATFTVWDLYLNVHAFINIVTCFDSAHVQFEILGDKAVLVSDAGDEFEAKTLLAASTAQQVAKLKARTAQTKAGSGTKTAGTEYR
jgi:hypothetical protein